MTHPLPEFRKAIPAGIPLFGELVALAEDGRPDFHPLSGRMPLAELRSRSRSSSSTCSRWRACRRRCSTMRSGEQSSSSSSSRISGRGSLRPSKTVRPSSMPSALAGWRALLHSRPRCVPARRASVGEHEEPRDGSLRERTRRRRSACQGVSETPGALGRSRFRQGEAGHELLHPSEKTDRDRR